MTNSITGTIKQIEKKVFIIDVNGSDTFIFSGESAFTALKRNAVVLGDTVVFELKNKRSGGSAFSIISINSTAL